MVIFLGFIPTKSGFNCSDSNGNANSVKSAKFDLISAQHWSKQPNRDNDGDSNAHRIASL